MTFNNASKGCLYQFLVSFGIERILALQAKGIYCPKFYHCRMFYHALAPALMIARMEINDNAAFQRKCRDLQDGRDVDLAGFFSKRVNFSCTCLRKISGLCKEEQKKGICVMCGVQKKRTELAKCARCIVVQYCSKECQVADWRRHKEECARIVTGQAKGGMDDICLKIP